MPDLVHPPPSPCLGSSRPPYQEPVSAPGNDESETNQGDSSHPPSHPPSQRTRLRDARSCTTPTAAAWGTGKAPTPCLLHFFDIPGLASCAVLPTEIVDMITMQLSPSALYFFRQTCLPLQVHADTAHLEARSACMSQKKSSSQSNSYMATQVGKPFSVSILVLVLGFWYVVDGLPGWTGPVGALHCRMFCCCANRETGKLSAKICH